MNSVNVLVMGLMNHAVPVARRKLLENGFDAWRRSLIRIGIFLAAVAGAFGVFASVFAESLLSVTLGPAYAAFANLVPFAAAHVFLSACNTVFSAVFRTAEMPQVGFAAKCGSAVITLLMAYPLLKTWGVTGAAAGLVLTQASWTAIYAAYAACGTLHRSRLVMHMHTGS
jgi:O-antigen/teichoic acid export membrane protein